jgi:hypothetical protein
MPTIPDREGLTPEEMLCERCTELQKAIEAARFAHDDTGTGPVTVLGAAGLILHLRDDKIGVYHATDNVKLAELSTGGNEAWDEIWRTFDRLGFTRLVK